MLLIADTSPIISLLLIGKFDLLEKLFPGYLIPEAVLEELKKHNEIAAYKSELDFLIDKSKNVHAAFPISGIEIGETEAIILYRELNADYLLIDDKKAREKAELLQVKCIGTLGILYMAYRKSEIEHLRPLFNELLLHGRYFSKKYINLFLQKSGEEIISPNYLQKT